MIHLLFFLNVFASMNTSQQLVLPLSVLQGGTGTTTGGGGGGSQWITTGSNIYYNVGFAGVGTTNPAAPFEVDSSIFGASNPTLYVNVNGTGGSEVDGLIVNSDGQSGIRISGGGSIGSASGLFIGNVSGSFRNFTLLNDDAGSIAINTNATDVITARTDGGLDVHADNFLIEGSNGTNPATVKFWDAASDNFVALKSPSTLATSTTFTLMAGDGTSGQAITTDGAGNLRFRNRGNGFMSLSTGSLTSIVANEIVGAGKTAHNILIENIDASAAGFTCLTNPTFTLLDCGTSAGACTSGTTTIGSVTLTGANSITDGTVSSGTLLIGHYWAWQITAGSCTLLNAVGNAEFTPQ